MEIWPFVICVGLKLAVTPVGSPDTLNVASWLKPFVLLRLMEYAALCPCKTFAVAGPAVTLKLVRAVSESVAVDTADSPSVVRVTRPYVAPGGIRKETLVGLELVTGAPMVPPPCWLSVTWASAGAPSARLVPVIVMTFPTAPDLGLKSVIAGEPTTTATARVVVFPATSVAAIGIRFVPETRVAVQETAPA